jgi:hypothetical protein
MSNYIQNNVEFTIQQYTPTKLGNRASTATYNALVNNKGSYIINAVEIDWNGAQLGDKTLNTTGEVLSRYKVAI